MRTMAETFRTPADRDNWEVRRRLLLDMMGAALAPLASLGLETREINGWAFCATLMPMQGDASLNRARHAWEKPDTMILIARLRAMAGFCWGKDVRRQADIQFVPGTATPTPEGRDAANSAISWLSSHLGSGAMPAEAPSVAKTIRSGRPPGRPASGCVPAV